jgi:uncharacterized protein YdcH (DUF465 family)
LRSMAQAFGPAEVDRLPLIPAGRGEVYGARYDAGSTPPVGLEQPWLGSPESGLAGSRDDGPMVVFGPGLALARRCLPASGGRLRSGPDPRSIAVGAGQISLLRGDFDNGALPPLAPLYLRTPDVVLKHQGKWYSQSVSETSHCQDSVFKRLLHTHAECEKRLEELSVRRFLTDAEQLEKNTLKKQKLALKDQMAQFVRVTDGWSA